MKISLIQVPFHLGQERVGMGLGPLRFIEAGIHQSLLDQGVEVKVETVHPNRFFDDELKTIASVNNALSRSVKGAITDGYFPVILRGNCNTCLGTLAGIDSSQTGIIWFDAHGDFNTPETTLSGYFDGMSLAVATGHCYQDILNIVPIPESRTLLVGVRDLDPDEKKLLNKSEVRLIHTVELKEGLEKSLLPNLIKLQSQVKDVYIHLDFDVLDPIESPGVDYKSPNGLSLDEVENAIKMIGEHFQLKAVNLTTYNPACDIDDRTLRIGFRLFNTIAEVVTNPKTRKFKY